MIRGRSTGGGAQRLLWWSEATSRQKPGHRYALPQPPPCQSLHTLTQYVLSKPTTDGTRVHAGVYAGRVGATLIEVVLATVVIAVLMGSMTSVVLLSSRAIDGGRSSTAKTAEARELIDDLTAELGLAQSVESLDDKSVTFTVPDLTGDGGADTISYAWSGVEGDPLTRRLNNGPEAILAEGVHLLNFTYLLRTMPGLAGVAPLVVYGKSGATAPGYRTWTGSQWSEEGAANDIGDKAQWVVAASCPNRDEIAAGVLDDDDEISLQIFNGSSWSAVSQVTSDCGADSERRFDIAYEQSSGELLIVYRYAGSSSFRYRTYNGQSLSNEGALALPLSGNGRWFRLVPKPRSDEVLLVVLDSNRDVAAAVWDGTGWTNSVLLESNAKAADKEGITAVYEGISGRALVAWTALGVMSFEYRIWNGSSWSQEYTGPSLGGSTEAEWLRMASDPTNNQIIIGTLDGASAVKMAVWNGSSWGSPMTVETGVPDTEGRPFDVAYSPEGGQALAVWGRQNVNNCFYRVWDGSGWSSEQAGPGLGNKVKWVQTRPGLTGSEIFVGILLKYSSAVECMRWNGSSLSASEQICANTGVVGACEAFMIAVPPAEE